MAGNSQSKSVQLSVLTTVSVTFQHGSGFTAQPGEDGSLALPSGISWLCPCLCQVLTPFWTCKGFFFSPWVDVNFFLLLFKFRVLGGLFYLWLHDYPYETTFVAFQSENLGFYYSNTLYLFAKVWDTRILNCKHTPF